MRSFLLATTFGAAQSLAVANKSKKPAVQALMESAITMLKNGATPAVVDFSEDILAEVSGVVIPAIINESLSDQRFIMDLHRRFEVILDASIDLNDAVTIGLAQRNQDVFQLNQEEQQASHQHKTCRDVEKIKCDHKRECEMELYRLWTSWVTEEEDLREIHASISGHFCPPDANGTLHTFRVTSVPYMQQYMAQKIIVDEAEVAYDLKRPICEDKHYLLDVKSAECNTHQTTLEEMACSHAMKISEVLGIYYTDHAQAASAYNCAAEEIMQLERDRKREWITLQVVNCLLIRIREQNGVPCDDSNGGVTDEVGVCEERHGLAVCSTEEGDPRLCLEYPEIPPHPPLCPARHQVVGACLPVVQPIPCEGEWHSQEYASLPAVPEPPFSETNPGCNAYPECVPGCAIPDYLPPVIDSCPGFIVDGCNTDNLEAGEYPLTLHRYVGGTATTASDLIYDDAATIDGARDGLADVRCCSIDGNTCQSMGFENGVEYTTPGGGTHSGCLFDVTYQTAMTTCHNAGMRICNSDEMQTCCNTGCWHNHHFIWVDRPFDQQLD